MDSVITIKDAGLIIIGLGLIILIAYCIAFMRNLIVTVKATNKILEDASVISKIAADKSKDVDKIISGAASSVSSISESIKGNQSTVAALTSLINAIGSLKKLLKKRQEC